MGQLLQSAVLLWPWPWAAIIWCWHGQEASAKLWMISFVPFWPRDSIHWPKLNGINIITFSSCPQNLHFPTDFKANYYSNGIYRCGSNDLNCIKIDLRNGEQFIFYCKRTLPAVSVSEKDRSVEPVNSSAFPGTKLSMSFRVLALLNLKNER